MPSARHTRTSYVLRSIVAAFIVLLLIKTIMASSNDEAVQASKEPMLIDYTRDSSAIQLDMSSGSASVDLGPVVVNEDGTLSRVTNWQKMTESEKKTTLRVLGKRNKTRLEALKSQQAAQADTLAEQVEQQNSRVQEQVTSPDSDGAEARQASSRDEL